MSPSAGTGSAAAMAVDAGDLTLGAGALAILRPALGLVEPGGTVSVLTSLPTFGDDLAVWCKVEHHALVQSLPVPGSPGRWVHTIARGAFGAPSDARELAEPLPIASGRLTTAATMSRAPFPDVGDPATGFAPRGALVEPGGPVYPVTLVERDRVAPPEIASLYDQAVSAQWDASRDIPWAEIKPLAPVLERAVGQLMTFLAENELSALWLPSKFISRLHPAFAEVAMLLASQLNDEARHIDVFMKRARAAGGHPGVSSVTTSQSLLSLLQIEDFTEASFLLSVLGEGTFLDLLKFIETHAPDAPTALLVKKARADETRHVHFGLAHVRHALQHDPSQYGRLEAAVRRRAQTMAAAVGVPAPIADALTVLAAGSDAPAAVRRGHELFRELLGTMHVNRTRRLEHAGFTPEQAQTLSDLHTPNFM